jgi:hypothetical protein
MNIYVSVLFLLLDNVLLLKKIALENSVIVVESIIRNLLIHDSLWFFRLSEISLSLLLSYKSLYISSKIFSERRILASDSVLRRGTISIPM